jgi:hypothetical protein
MCHCVSTICFGPHLHHSCCRHKLAPQCAALPMHTEHQPHGACACCASCTCRCRSVPAVNSVKGRLMPKSLNASTRHHYSRRRRGSCLASCPSRSRVVHRCCSMLSGRCGSGCKSQGGSSRCGRCRLRKKAATATATAAAAEAEAGALWDERCVAGLQCARGMQASCKLLAGCRSTFFIWVLCASWQGPASAIMTLLRCLVARHQEAAQSVQNAAHSCIDINAFNQVGACAFWRSLRSEHCAAAVQIQRSQVAAASPAHRVPGPAPASSIATSIATPPSTSPATASPWVIAPLLQRT